MIKLKKRYFFLLGLCLFIYSLFDPYNYKGIKMFEEWTTISLSSYEFEVESEVITAGAFGSDSYRQYKLSFNEDEFDKLLSTINSQTELWKRDLWFSDSTISPISVAYNSRLAYSYRPEVGVDCFNTMEMYKSKKVIIVSKRCN